MKETIEKLEQVQASVTILTNAVSNFTSEDFETEEQRDCFCDVIKGLMTAQSELLRLYTILNCKD